MRRVLIVATSIGLAFASVALGQPQKREVAPPNPSYVAGQLDKIAYLTSRLDKAEARITALEANLAKFKAKYKTHAHNIIGNQPKTSAPDICFSNFGCPSDDF